MSKTKGSEPKVRKTLMELASETTVRDPASHARHQVSELDKTAKRSQAQRKKCNDQIEADNKEIAKLTEQISRLRKKYDPLCEHLAQAKEQKQNLLKTLSVCVQDEKKIMQETKGVIQVRRLEESKMTKRMGTMELELERGYTLRTESTFHQGNPSHYNSGSPTKSSRLNATTGVSTQKSSSNHKPSDSKARTLPAIK